MNTRVVRTVPVIDELVSDTGALVLVARGRDSRVVRVSPLGHLIRELAREGITAESLTRQLVSQLGSAPPDQDVQLAVSEAVSDLQREGLVTCDVVDARKEST